MLKAALISLVGTGMTAHAGIGVFNWENSSVCQVVQYDQGLQATNLRGTLCTRLGTNPYNGTVISRDCKGIRFVHIGGLPFTPLSIDLAEYSSSVRNTSLIFEGRTEAGESVSVTFVIDGLSDGAGGIEDFQTFLFPAEFVDLVELTGPNTLFSCDNLVFETVIPPPLPAASQVGPGFFSATTLHSRDVHDDHLIVGLDFSYATGFSSPSKARFLTGTDSSLLTASGPWVDPTGATLFYRDADALLRRTSTISEQIVNLAEVTGAGFPITSFGWPRPYGNSHLFLAYDFSGNDAYWILEKTNDGSITEKVGPTAALPVGNSTDSPRAFPYFFTASGNAYAFDTSLNASNPIQRLYASFYGGPISLLVSEGDWIDSADVGLGILQKILGIEFTSETVLKVTAQTTTGEYLFTYNAASGFSGSFRLGLNTIAPINTGSQVLGRVINTPHGPVFFESQSTSELFRKSDDQWYRVIGRGDKIGDRIVAYLEYLACPASMPLRMIVDVRFEDNGGISHNLELELTTPAELPPRIYSMTRDPSGYVFLGLDRLTHERTYILKESTNLVDWNPLGPVEVVPVQNLIISPDASSRRFFKVEESPVESTEITPDTK